MKQGIKIDIITNTVKTTCHCSVTGDVYVITVPLHKWMDWKQGELIQKAFPMLQPHEREMMQTGITPAERNQMYNC